MKKNLILLVAIFIITLIAGIVVLLLPSGTANAPTTSTTTNTNTDTNATPINNTNAQEASIANLIEVNTPSINGFAASPLKVEGRARGTWYFEASFPVELKDANGKTIAEAPAQAKGDWMTEEFVPFSLSLTFPAQPRGTMGTLILHKDNPSGEPERDQSLSIPITF